MSDLKELRRALGEAVDQLNDPAVIADAARFSDTEAHVAELKGQIERATKAQQARAALARPVAVCDNGEADIIRIPGRARLAEVGSPQSRVRSFDDCLAEVRDMMGIRTVDGSKGFSDFSTFLEAVAHSARHGNHDADGRLTRSRDVHERATLGQSVTDFGGGGFMVQTDFANALLMRIYETGKLWQKTTKFTITTNSNSIKIPAVDETSRAEGQRFGGVRVYLTSEGDPTTASTIKGRTVDLDLKKASGLIYATEEMMEDSEQIVQLANTALAQEFAFKMDDWLVRGTGNGQPLGILSAPCKVTTPTETGQKTKTILWENILNMENRMWAPSLPNAEWIINSETLVQLRQMVQVIGTAGVPVYLPPGSASGSPYGTLLSRPVTVIEQASGLGTEGDIIFADLSQMITAQKGGLKSYASMHVQFLTGQTAFRFVLRIDAQPWWHTSLTPAQGSTVKSPFVTLKSR